ncbi:MULTISPECIES: nitronate monooxygenase [unclassified Sphingopyxis]|uniref:NAD(P)H-dependent flavin oxidoreductase n=1 Tax=unclassified Sphingopyxis TaxID=2614943 RepID=UPI0028610628|nr:MULTISPECIES: nitronate monooxygenase [unclassified Sphingopyxis]MDR6834089.1 nitronate monooxygenase [Sphingopyxis sp. BE122]MDR7226357.1 nitronate monooxygenase [Sphingopyxis sp. BE259]
MTEPNLAARLRTGLRLPVMAGPMFIASTADLVIAQCNAGIIGAMPALNPRSTEALDKDLARIAASVGARPWCVNLVAHKSNERLAPDLEVVLRHKVPIVVLALAADPGLVRELQANGSLVFQDVIRNRHAQKCAEMGVDGIIAVAAGAGGHTGDQSPFALVGEIREWWDGLLLLAGCIANGRGVLASEAMGADLAYIGSPFLASSEANTQPGFKQMLVDGSAKDVLVTSCFTGVKASFLRPSLIENGLDPDNLVPATSGGAIDINNGGANSKAWRDIWSAGQGIGAVKEAGPAGAWIDWLADDYAAARRAMGLAQ